MTRPLWMTGLVLMLAGCIPGPRMASEERMPLAELRYPAEAPRGADLDIIVVRKGNHIMLANRTAHSYADVQLWLNEQWVSPIEQIDIGTGNRFSLNHFVDEHGRTFPVAGFLAPDRARELVHAELYDPRTDQRHRLTVQLERR